jgi:hypothetical protein
MAAPPGGAPLASRWPDSRAHGPRSGPALRGSHAPQSAGRPPYTSWCARPSRRRLSGYASADEAVVAATILVACRQGARPRRRTPVTPPRPPTPTRTVKPADGRGEIVLEPRESPGPSGVPPDDHSSRDLSPRAPTAEPSPRTVLDQPIIWDKLLHRPVCLTRPRGAGQPDRGPPLRSGARPDPASEGIAAGSSLLRRPPGLQLGFGRRIGASAGPITRRDLAGASAESAKTTPRAAAVQVNRPCARSTSGPRTPRPRGASSARARTSARR